MMISVNTNRNTVNLNEEYEQLSSTNSRDELTLVTGNNYTERAQSVVDDDVGPDVNLDYYPVREFSKEKIYQIPQSAEPFEIIDVPERIKSYVDKSKIVKCEASIDNFQPSLPNSTVMRDVDEYDLEDRHYGFDESNRYCDELLQTVRHIPFPSVTLTKHETPQLEDHNSSPSPLMQHKLDHLIDHLPPTTDIGRQITQLARRIESLGNISRVCQDDIENRPFICLPDPGCHMAIAHQEPARLQDYSLKAARKLDEIERLQKKQEAMQTRLVALARDLTKLPSSQPALQEPVNSDDIFHAKVLKSPKRSGKKSGQKSRKSNKSRSKSPPSSAFLKNILNEINEPKSNEMPLLSSSYCLHNDISTGSPETGISESTSKYLNNELTNIRAEFRNQVEEIRKLLSERYQQSNESIKRPNQTTQHVCEPLSDQITKSIQRLNRDSSPTLRNITNINNNNNEECPLDKYLVKTDNVMTQLPSLNSDANPSLRPGILPSVARAIKNKQRLLSDPIEAEKFLIELSNRRANLENNLSCLERTREGDFLFSILEKLQGDERDVDIARVQAMVDDAIAGVTPAVNQEVRSEFQKWMEKRQAQREKQLIAEEEEKQLVAKKNIAKPVKWPQCTNYNVLPSTSAVPGKPWVCKKYLDVRSKVDSGVRKMPEKSSSSRLARSQSPSKLTTIPPSDMHATWANRRRYRTPYLHFVNDVKLAKKPIAPLGEERRRAPVITKHSSKTVTTKSTPTKSVIIDDELKLMSVKQYSLNYKEEEQKPSPVQSKHLINTSTSPRTASEPSSTHPQVIEPPPVSPTLSEKGTGFQIRSKTSSKHREDRVGPYAPLDPTDTLRIDSHPVHVFIDKADRRPSPVNVGPDINNLRRLIERELLHQIHIPTPSTSADHSDTLTRGDIVATPLPTDVANSYSTQFSPEHSMKEPFDRTVTPHDDVKTPEPSQAISDFSFKPSRVSTPSVSAATTSQKISERKPVKQEMVSAAMQTICDNAVQTAEAKEVQTMPHNHATQTPRSPRHPQSVESFSGSSDFYASQSDTQAHSFSDGMWLYDRSEGEMAPIQVENVDRWRMGSCPDHPLWYNGTDELMDIDQSSSASFGEFARPTLPGLVPTRDPVLQLKTIPFKRTVETPTLNNTGDDLIYMGHHREPQSPTFRSLGVSRDSKSRFTTPRNYGMSPSNFNDSEGEVEYNDDDVASYEDAEGGEVEQVSRRRFEDDDGVNQSSGEYRNESPYMVNMQQSNESNDVNDYFTANPVRDSQSDRVNVDINKYLRASKQSHSDTSDAGGLLSTAQIVANAFRGGDSVDLEGSSEFGLERYNENQHHTTKPTVKIPSLGTVEQSNPSASDEDLEVIDISGRR